MKTVSRFFLHGIEGVYNYGCEAIIRGTVDILSQHFPESRIIYLSRRPEEDRKALAGCQVEIRDNQRIKLRYHPTRIITGISSRLGYPLYFMQDKIRDITPDDCLISIGGDIFTLPAPPYPKGVSLPSLLVPNYCVKRGVPVVLWGASVGPFEDWPASVPVFTRFLQNLSLITAREPVTVEYLTRIGLQKNVATVFDPAFLMSAKTVDEDWPFARDNRPVIGVNFSPLSVCFQQGKTALESVRTRQVTFVQWLIEQYQAKIILIPHVVTNNNIFDNDSLYLQSIYQEVMKSHPDDIAILPDDLGAQRTKGVISQCDALLAARMHCAVAGVSSGVPTLFLSYSAKASGMATLVYGHDRWCININQLCDDSTKNIVHELFMNKEQISQHLLGQREQATTMALSAGAALQQCLTRAGN